MNHSLAISIVEVMQAQVDGWTKVSGLAFEVTVAGFMPDAEGLQSCMRMVKYVMSRFLCCTTSLIPSQFQLADD
jgi:hypothetical protein